MFLIIKIDAKVLTQLQTNTNPTKTTDEKTRELLCLLPQKNNRESPPEQTAKAFRQRTTKHQHTARPNKIL